MDSTVFLMAVSIDRMPTLLNDQDTSQDIWVLKYIQRPYQSQNL